MKYQYLTKNNKEQHTLPINVPEALAQKVSDSVGYVVEHAPPEAGRGMASVLRWWIGQFKTVMKVQKSVKLALDICDELVSPDADGAINDAYAHQVKVIRMALLGCATKTATEFTGELSREYIERYGDE